MLPGSTPRPAPRPVASSVEELLEGADARQPFRTGEFRSTSSFERVSIDGQPFVVKHIHVDDDFSLRVSGDIGCRAVRAYGIGLCDVASDVIDHAIVGAALGVARNGWGGTLLMRDVSDDLVPQGGQALPEAQHHRFIHHLAGMSARTWGWSDEWELMPYAARWRLFDHAGIEGERRLGWPEPVPRIAADGWEQFAARAGARVARGVDELRCDVTPLVTALQATPSCLIHGDWKAANLGSAPDGRTILLDWALVGEGPVNHELAWYLALNRARLPHPKEQVIDEFRNALGANGIDTDAWWDRQLALALLGAVVEIGWEKALGDEAELAWWCDRAGDALALL